MHHAPQDRGPDLQCDLSQARDSQLVRPFLAIALLFYYTVFIVIVKGFLESFLFFFLVVVSRWYQRSYVGGGGPARPKSL